ncbi:MAG: FAD-dependent oxidoreductase [Thermomicrobiales bacterium]|nr:FAD-dependent oxidoreductase [Thermomicrobiales bacterium]
MNARASRRSLLKAGGAVAGAGAMAIAPVKVAQVFAQGGWDHETDVVVVGCGISGTPAAIEAARAGAEVIRFEKGPFTGGNMSHSQGIIYLGGGTDLQKSHGFEDTPEQMAAYLNAFMAPWDDPEFVKFYTENTVEHYNWLLGEGVTFGAEFYPGKWITAPNDGGLNFCGNEVNYPYNEITPPIPRGHCVTGLGAALSVALQASAEAEQNITTIVSSTVIALVTSDEGRVVGVVVNIDGEEQTVLARKGVILASGGYEWNAEMAERTVASQLEASPIGNTYHTNTGDGIRLAAGLGARLRNMDLTFTTIFAYPPDEKCQSVIVNKVGRRFVNEASYGAVIGQEIVHHQGGIAWLLMDQVILESIEEAGFSAGNPFATADSLAELAEAIEVPAMNLETEIALYNSQAAEKFDPLYRKPEEFLTPFGDGPYHAFALGLPGPVAYMTTGHVQIDLETRVLDHNNEPIPGLYGVGQGAAGLGRRQYNSGIRLGEGSLFGRVSGRTVAAADSWEGGETSSHFSPPPGYGTVVEEASPEAVEDLGEADVTVEAFDLGYIQTEISIAANTDTVIGLLNNGVIPHDLAIQGTDFKTPLANPGETTKVLVNLEAGEYIYYCTVAGHRAAGMEGTLTVS